MYRSVEDGSTKQMALAPQVFREVLREYRSNSSADVDAVVNAIERLPDKLLFESNWLSRKNLTLEENIRATILYRELKRGEALSTPERADLVAELSAGYRKLFEAGITESINCIRLIGAPLTTGFWKSYAEVKRGKRWTWDEASFAESLREAIFLTMGWACNAIGSLVTVTGTDAVTALQSLRKGESPPEFDEGMTEMIVSALFARDHGTTHVADITLQIESPASKQSCQCRFLEKAQQEITSEQFKLWIETHDTLLANNEIKLVLTDYCRWELPSPSELHRLGRISGYRIPDVFGPPEVEQALSKFVIGDLAGCIKIFARMLTDKDNPSIRNNLAFCQILDGDFANGLVNVTAAIESQYNPLFELNKGVCEFLQGDVESATQSLRNALQQLQNAENKFDRSTDYALLVEPAELKVKPHAELPVDSAILINLFRMEKLDRKDLEVELTRLHPEKPAAWFESYCGGP